MSRPNTPASMEHIVIMPANTADIANTGFLERHRKYEAQKTAGITLNTPNAMPKMVMLSPKLNVAR